MNAYSTMSDFEINKMVAEFLGNPDVRLPRECISGSVVSYYVNRRSDVNREGQIVVSSHEVRKDFCNNPSDTFPIIVSNLISLLTIHKGKQIWLATGGDDGEFYTEDSNPLRAAMIVFLKMKIKEVE